MILTKIPVSIEDMRTRLGMRDQGWGSLKEVQEAQDIVADWVLIAARSRWPQFNENCEGDIALAYFHAREIWPRFDDLADQLTQAERTALRKSRPMA